MAAPDENRAEVYAYLRGDTLVALNFADRPVELAPAGLPPGGVVAVSTRSERDGVAVPLRPLSLAPDEGVIINLTPREVG